MMKRLCVADGAQSNRESLLHDSRAGVHPDAEALTQGDVNLVAGHVASYTPGPCRKHAPGVDGWSIVP